MLKLIKYLKPYWWMVVLAIGLLFVQAMADLALPNYMSDIVNVGIQQGGVEMPVPRAVRASRMEQYTLLMSPEDAEAVLAAYELVDVGDAAATEWATIYPALESEPVYVLATAENELPASVTGPLSRALAVASVIDGAAANPEKAAQLFSLVGVNMAEMPAGGSVYSLLATIPPEQRAAGISTILGNFSSMGDNALTQLAVNAVKVEYSELGINQSRLQTTYIARVGGLMLLVTLLAAACTILVGFLSARTAAGLSRDLRRDVFRKVESFSKAEFETFSTASLITRTTNDVNQLQMLIVIVLRMVIFSPIIAVGAIIRAAEKSPSMTWIIGLGVGVLLLVILVVFSVTLPKFTLMQKLVDRLNLVTRENLSGLMVIRAFNSQKFELGRFEQANTDLAENTRFINRVMASTMPTMMLIMNGLSLLIVWVGGQYIAASTLQVGDMMAFLQYTMQVVFSFLMMSFAFIMLPRAAVSAKRISEVLNVEPTIKDPVNPRFFDTSKPGKVEFRNVSFRYPNAEENVICGISFTAEPGQTTAIIGGTGSGKSTLINLIPRFFDVTEGAVLVDGVDVREVTQGELRERIGYIPQRGVLFTGTVESNLRFADENVSAAALQKAIEIAQASEFISSMEGGMQAPISQGGSNVSGGQKQRLAIARALVKKPPIYIFDDALSALDFKTDSALRKALKQETGNSTMIIVTQRISTVKNAEQIIVLDEGDLVGKGTHAELMKTCATYREMAASQLTGEELSR